MVGHWDDERLAKRSNLLAHVTRQEVRVLCLHLSNGAGNTVRPMTNVGVGEEEEFTSCLPHALMTGKLLSVPRGRNWPAGHKRDPGIVRSVPRNNLRCVIFGVVVDYDDIVILVRLIHQTFETCTDIGCLVPCREDDADPRTVTDRWWTAGPAEEDDVGHGDQEEPRGCDGGGELDWFRGEH